MKRVSYIFTTIILSNISYSAICSNRIYSTSDNYYTEMYSYMEDNGNSYGGDYNVNFEESQNSPFSDRSISNSPFLSTPFSDGTFRIFDDENDWDNGLAIGEEPNPTIVPVGDCQFAFGFCILVYVLYLIIRKEKNMLIKRGETS